MNILGLNFLHPNAAAAIFVDGKLVAAAEEERYNRVKFSAGIPLSAIAFSLEQANLAFKDIDVITYARSTNTRIVDKDQIHFQDRIYKIDSLYDRYRISLKFISFKETLARRFDVPVESLVFKLQEQDHHFSHMLSGFHYSPFEEALIVSCDAFGDFVSLKIGIGRGHDIEILKVTAFPHSIGLFYTMVSQFLGFREYGDESKVMGLSTFGSPEQIDLLRTIISREDSELHLNLKYFEQNEGVGTTWSESTPDISQLYNQNLEHLLGPRRDPTEELTSRHKNIASSMQNLTEELVFSIINDLHDEHGISQLVFTGGLAYNSLLNGRVLSKTPMAEVYVPPTPGNSGLCLGSALALLGDSVERTEMTHAFWGPAYGTQQIASSLENSGLPYQKVSDPVATAVDLLAAGKCIGWFQGRMELGPRSLGNRCILMSPQAPDPQRIKQRDTLKPFGISILAEHADDYLLNAHRSPFMSFMGIIRERYRPEFENTLLNDFCRYQTVGPENPLFHRLLVCFLERTGLPFLINTSLNPEGEPIIATPQQLIDNFEAMGLDSAILGDLQIEEACQHR
ncbi:MAG: carbamoyltransferase C-terminal domain-containing protein [Acidobacteriota bacterium]